jgi:hypothetical protein
MRCFLRKGAYRLQSAKEQPDDLPDNGSSKATITVKGINENRYYYGQWRDGEKINRSTNIR